MTRDQLITPADGLHAGVPFEVYQSWNAVNQSALKSGPTMMHVRYEMDNPSPPSPSMELGNALHVAAFEPSRFAREFVVAPDVDRRTKDGKERWAEFVAGNQGSTILTAADHAAVKGMADALNAHPAARMLLSKPGHFEGSILWTDLVTGVRCKARLDKLLDMGVIVDLKTTRSAAPHSFAHDAAKYGYHRQAAWYVDAAAMVGIEAAEFAFVAVENTPPYAVAVYSLAPIDIAAGRELNRRALAQYAKAVQENRWPGYSDNIETLALPAWAVRDVETEVTQ